ncbi:MAG: four helix bundle protein [Burkholderiales bacterium]
MDKSGSFEDLIAWQKARVLSRDIYNVTRSANFSKDYSLVDQIRRACISILSNIAEGFERGRRPEFHQFLVVAKGSCGEVRSQLYIALDAGYLDNDTFQKLHEMAHELGRVISGLALAVRSQRDAGKKKG